MSILTIERKVLERNDGIADENRQFFHRHGIFVVNLTSSPGSGKTSLVEKTIETMKNRLRIMVIEGDVQTDLDAQRIDRLGVAVAQIVTHGACHLEASLVRKALQSLDAQNAQLLIIENVGNLVCPAGYDLGEAMKIVIISVTEGDDKPLKYPAMFRNASVCVVNKIDLLPYVRCDIQALQQAASTINPQLVFFKTSCVTDEGIKEWCGWLESKIGK